MGPEGEARRPYLGGCEGGEAPPSRGTREAGGEAPYFRRGPYT